MEQCQAAGLVWGKELYLEGPRSRLTPPCTRCAPASPSKRTSGGSSAMPTPRPPRARGGSARGRRPAPGPADGRPAAPGRGERRAPRLARRGRAAGPAAHRGARAAALRAAGGPGGQHDRPGRDADGPRGRDAPGLQDPLRRGRGHGPRHRRRPGHPGGGAGHPAGGRPALARPVPVGPAPPAGHRGHARRHLRAARRPGGRRRPGLRAPPGLGPSASVLWPLPVRLRPRARRVPLPAGARPAPPPRLPPRRGLALPRRPGRLRRLPRAGGLHRQPPGALPVALVLGRVRRPGAGLPADPGLPEGPAQAQRLGRAPLRGGEGLARPAPLPAPPAAQGQHPGPADRHRPEPQAPAPTPRLGPPALARPPHDRGRPSGLAPSPRSVPRRLHEASVRPALRHGSGRSPGGRPPRSGLLNTLPAEAKALCWAHTQGEGWPDVGHPAALPGRPRRHGPGSPPPGGVPQARGGAVSSGCRSRSPSWRTSQPTASTPGRPPAGPPGCGSWSGSPPRARGGRRPPPSSPPRRARAPSP